MNSPQKNFVWCLLAAALVAVIIAILKSNGPATKDSVKNDPVVGNSPAVKSAAAEVHSGRFMGSESCRKCHEDICKLYERHPMGRSACEVSQDDSGLKATETQFDVPVVPGSPNFLRYSVERSAGSMWHIEQSIPIKGSDPIYTQKVQTEFAVGSGKRGKSYLINHDGVLLMSPVTWYTQGNRWDLSPGTDQRSLHFTRRIVDGCVLCHVSRPLPRPESINLFEKAPFAELAIGCERCHGAGEDHIRHHENHEKLANDPIINPTNLSATKRDDVCFQCHLIGESRIARFGKTDFGFQPGTNLEEHWTIFLRSAAGVDSENRTEAVSQVEQMLNSGCYKASQGSMGCATCHDPHSTPREHEKSDFFNGKCRTCHSSEKRLCKSEAPDSPLDNCIQCHMPSISANDVPHTSQTDHRILRTPKKQVIQRDKGSVEFTIFRANSGTIPAEELDRAQAIQMVRTAESTNKTLFAVDAIPILERWTRKHSDDFLAMEALGTAYLLLQDPNRAEGIWKASLKHRPRDERFLRRLFFLYHDQNRNTEAVKVARQLLEVNAFDYEVHGRYAHVLGQLDRLAEGINHAEIAVDLNPSSYEIYEWLSEVCGATGDQVKAEKYRKLYDSLRLDATRER